VGRERRGHHAPRALCPGSPRRSGLAEPLPAALLEADGGAGRDRAEGDVELGNADEQKPAAEGSVEAWGRSPENPVGGCYGLTKGLRGRFGNYVPPVLEALGLAEVEHNARNNRMRAL
jgi:hypothetical protein